MPEQYKFFAFISYSSQDLKWGKRLHRKLEHYQLPATLCSQHGWKRRPMKPVFFAPTDIQPGELNEELQHRLESSLHLIVICSPHSAQSEWVGKEIEYFHKLGRTKNIHFFIVDGIPHSGNPATECFNPIVDKLGLPEILGANVHERIYLWPWLNRERAYVQLISKLLKVEFDAIWRRHKRLLTQKILALTIGICALVFIWIATIKANTPFSAEITINDIYINKKLPSYNGGAITLFLGNEMLTDTIRENEKIVFNRIPPKYYNENVRITFSHPNYVYLDTIIPLKETSQLYIRHNPDIYGHVHFRLWDTENDTFVPNCKITIYSDKCSYTTTSNTKGIVDMRIPIENQQKTYRIESDYNLESSILNMPCGEDDAIQVLNNKMQ